MFKLTKLIKLHKGVSAAERDMLIAALRAASQPNAQILRSLLEPTMEGVVNGGDYIWHMQFRNREALQNWQRTATPVLANPAIAHLESAAYEGSPSDGATGQVRRPDLASGIYRTLILRVDAKATPAQLAGFEADMRSMPVYIPAIVNWQLTRIAEGSGSRQWTHVWEQEYVSIDGLQGPYTMHPIHWGHVDRWYQPDSPDQIVDAFLCHAFCGFKGSMLASRAA